MNRRARAAAVVLALVTAAAPAATAGAAPPVTPAVRPAQPALAPSGELPLVPVALNRRGQVLGYGTLADGPDIQLWDRGTLVDVTEGEFAFPLALGEDGDVLGASVVGGTGPLRAVLRVDDDRVVLGDDLSPGGPGINGRGQATLSRGGPGQVPAVGVWQDGAFRAAPLPPGRPAALTSINEQGLAVGMATGLDGDPRPEAVAWDTRTGRLARLGRLGGHTEARVVNEAGAIAGLAHPSGGATRTWARRDGRLVDIGTLGGPGATLAAGRHGGANGDRSMNIVGDLVGQSDTAAGEEHAFLHRHGRMIDLGTLGGRSSEAHAVNVWGQVVGVSDTASGAQHGFLWQEGRMADLGPVGRGGPAVPPPPLDINDRGTVVAAAPDGTSGLTWSVSPLWGAGG